jgi:hypothetical protein
VIFKFKCSHSWFSVRRSAHVDLLLGKMSLLLLKLR